MAVKVFTNSADFDTTAAGLRLTKTNNVSLAVWGGSDPAWDIANVTGGVVNSTWNLVSVGTSTVEELPPGELHTRAGDGIGTGSQAGRTSILLAGDETWTFDTRLYLDQLGSGFSGPVATLDCYLFDVFTGSHIYVILFSADSIWVYPGAWPAIKIADVAVPTGFWFNLRVVENNNLTRIFFDGVLVYSGTLDYNSGANPGLTYAGLLFNYTVAPAQTEAHVDTVQIASAMQIYADDSPTALLIEAGNQYAVDSGPGNYVDASGFSVNTTTTGTATVEFQRAYNSAASVPLAGWSGYASAAILQNILQADSYPAEQDRYLFVRSRYNSNGQEGNHSLLDDGTLVWVPVSGVQTITPAFIASIAAVYAPTVALDISRTIRGSVDARTTVSGTVQAPATMSGDVEMPATISGEVGG